MPLLMPRSSPFWIVIVVSLGGMLPAARAADPPCPTQVVPAGAPPAAAGAAPEAKPLRGEGNISLDSDKATLGADNSMTLEGNVLVRQGEREIRANEVHYNPQGSWLSAPGHIDYSDPLVSVTGAGGSYSTAAGADFKSAEFALRQRAARGAAQDMRLTPQGVIRLRKVMFTTCPAKDSSWQLKADSIVLDTRNRVGTGRGAQVDFMGVPPVYLPRVSFPLGTERRSGFLFPGIGNTSYAGLQLSVPYYWSIAVSADYGLGPAGLVRYGFDSELVDFQRPAGATRVTGWRADAMPGVLLDLTGPGYFLRPALAWRATGYRLDNTAPGEPRSPSRTLPIASLDTGLVFERDSGSRKQRKLTLEPRIQYLDVPYRNQDQLPVFDSALPDLNPVALFRTNRYVGADRVGDANQVSAGLTSRLLDAHNGRQFLAATFGQSYHFETPRVILPGEAPASGKHSDFVAQLALTAFQDWSADAGVQWDPQNERSERTTVNLQYKAASDAVLNLAYRYKRFVLVQQLVQGVAQPFQQGFDQVEFSAAWPIRRQWNVFTRDVYSLRDHTPLERFAGFEYRACCWRVRLGARRFVNSHDPTASQETGVWLAVGS